MSPGIRINPQLIRLLSQRQAGTAHQSSATAMQVRSLTKLVQMVLDGFQSGYGNDTLQRGRVTIGRTAALAVIRLLQIRNGPSG